MSDAGPGPARIRLAMELRGLRERQGLSLAALADRTPYSKSTWGRYLSGGSLPPWSAVQALTALADEPEARLRALWELAEHEWSGRDVVGPARTARPAPPKDDPAAGPRAETDPASASAPDAAQDSMPDSASSKVPSETPGPATNEATNESSPTTPTRRSIARLARRPRTALTAIIAAAALTCLAFVSGTAVAGRHPADTAGGTVWGPIGCAGQTCTGLDPGDPNCGVAPDSLGETTTSDGADLQIRYKAACQAAWGRVWHSAVGDTLSITSAQGQTMNTVIVDKYTADSYAYTYMIPAVSHGLQLRACLTPPHGTATCVSAAVP